MCFLKYRGRLAGFRCSTEVPEKIGQEMTDKTQQEIAQASAGLEPAIDVRVVYVDVSEYPNNKIIALLFDGRVVIY